MELKGKISMNIKKILIMVLILMFLLVPITYAADGKYTVPSVIKDITVRDDGAAEITEEIVYDIKGSVNGVYREIPTMDNQTVSNISVETPGYYNKLEINNNQKSTQLKIWLYSDAAKTQKTENAKVKVTYKYTISKGVKIYNDIAEVQYMTWGDEWDTKVDHMESTIHIPGSKDNVEYWNNPEKNVISSQWTTDNTLTTRLENINSQTSFEQRLIMPKSYFTRTDNAQIIPLDAKNLIKQDQKNYKEKTSNEKNIQKMILVTLVLMFAIPVALYLLYGKEPKINYNAEYEYDLPTNATPVQVNSIVVGNVGQLDLNALSATILDLIDRNYFTIVYANGNQTIIRQTGRDTSELKEHEIIVIEFLSQYAVNGDISIDSVGRSSNRNNFKTFHNSWIQHAKKDVPPSMIKQYFDNKGNKLFKRVPGILIVFLLLIILSAFFIHIPFNILVSTMIMLILLIPFYIVILLLLYLLPNTFAGRWTLEGKEFHDKWKNFERYIKDYSLIEQSPPASVQIWGKYLVYAAALGCADEATKNMKQYFNSLNRQYHLDNSSSVAFVYYNGFANMENSFITLSRPENSASGSGIGRVGSGGFGGGGGGIF